MTIDAFGFQQTTEDSWQGDSADAKVLCSKSYSFYSWRSLRYSFFSVALADLSHHEVSAACLPVPQLRHHCTYMGQHASFRNSNTIQCIPKMICEKKWLERRGVRDRSASREGMRQGARPMWNLYLPWLQVDALSYEKKSNGVRGIRNK